jgi:8-oxo-dGTP diphosphatase
MKREYPDIPVVGVGAVVLDGNRVLLVRRGQEPLKGQWSLPGGALELGEALEEGIRREVREETGLEVEPVRIVAVLDRISRDEEGRIQYHYVLVDYLCRVTGGSLACASDAVDVKWAAWNELEGVAEFTLEVLRKVWSAESQSVGSVPPFQT